MKLPLYRLASLLLSFAATPMEQVSAGWLDREWKTCISGGCNPVKPLIESGADGAQDIARGFAQGVREEFEPAMDYLFDEKLYPLSDRIAGQLESVASASIERTEASALAVLKSGREDLLAIEEAFFDDIDDLVENVDEASRTFMRDLFHEINRARAEAIVGARTVIADSDIAMERRIDQLALVMMETLAKAEHIANTAPETFFTELVQPAIQEVSALEEQFFDHLVEFEAIVACDLTGIRKQFDDTMRETIGLVPFSRAGKQCIDCGGLFRYRCHPCCNVALQRRLNSNDPPMNSVEQYRFTRCAWAERMTLGASIQDILDHYNQLELLANQRYCYARSFNNSSGAMTEAKEDVLEAARAYRLWKEISLAE